MSDFDDLLQLFRQLDKESQIDLFEALKRLHNDPEFDAIAWLREVKENRKKDINHDSTNASKKSNE